MKSTVSVQFFHNSACQPCFTNQKLPFEFNLWCCILLINIQNLEINVLKPFFHRASFAIFFNASI